MRVSIEPPGYWEPPDIGEAEDLTFADLDGVTAYFRALAEVERVMGRRPEMEGPDVDEDEDWWLCAETWIAEHGPTFDEDGSLIWFKADA